MAELQELPAARERLEQAYRLRPDHPSGARTLTNLGIVLNELGEVPAARERLERSVAVYGRTL